MALCPNCSAVMDIFALTCRRCKVDVSPAASWHPVPQSSHEEEALRDLLRLAQDQARADISRIAQTSYKPGVGRFLAVTFGAILLTISGACLWAASGAAFGGAFLAGAGIFVGVPGLFILMADGGKSSAIATGVGVLVLALTLGVSLILLQMLGGK